MGLTFFLRGAVEYPVLPGTDPNRCRLSGAKYPPHALTRIHTRPAARRGAGGKPPKPIVRSGSKVHDIVLETMGTRPDPGRAHQRDRLDRVPPGRDAAGQRE